jgi:predicted Zn-dependent protease
MVLGRMEEARRASAEALKLDPLSPAAMHTNAYLQVVGGEYQEALAALLTQVSLFPDFRAGHMTLALTAVLAGRPAEMRRALEGYARGDAELSTALAQVAAGIESRAERARALAALRSLEARLGSVAALWFAALGEPSAALAVLQRAYDGHADESFLSILVHPLLAPLHGDPAFRAMVEELGITPPATS